MKKRLAIILTCSLLTVAVAIPAGNTLASNSGYLKPGVPLVENPVMAEAQPTVAPSFDSSTPEGSEASASADPSASIAPEQTPAPSADESTPPAGSEASGTPEPTPSAEQQPTVVPSPVESDSPELPEPSTAPTSAISAEPTDVLPSEAPSPEASVTPEPSPDASPEPAASANPEPGAAPSFSAEVDLNAPETLQEAELQASNNLSIDSGSIFFDQDGGGAYYSQNGAPRVYYDPSANALTINGNAGGATSGNTITVQGGAHHFLIDALSITADAPLSVKAGASLNLTANGISKLEATGSGKAGIEVAEGAVIAIQGLSPNSNIQLEAIGGANAAGLGGGQSQNSGEITVNGNFLLSATGTGGGAGIGGGNGGNAGNIYLNNADIIALGQGGGAGIGGGKNGNASNVTILGGRVLGATGYTGIGGGEGGEGGNIKIFNGAVVRALADTTSGSAVGGGTSGISGTLEIDGSSAFSLNTNDSNKINATQQLGTCTVRYEYGFPFDPNPTINYYNKLTVVGGTANPAKNPNGKAEIMKDGDRIDVKADIPQGKAFVKWVSSDSTVPSSTDPEISFLMPKNALTLTAEFSDLPTPTPTPVPSPDPTPTPSPEPTPVPSPEPTVTPEPTPVPSPEPTVTPEPTPSPVPSPLPTPTVKPTPQPSAIPDLYLITVAYTDGGSVRPTAHNARGTENATNSFYILAEAGSDAGFDITPAAGWYVSGVFLDQERVNTGSGIYTIQNVQQDHQLRVEFTQIEEVRAPKTDDPSQWTYLLLGISVATGCVILTMRRRKRS